MKKILIVFALCSIGQSFEIFGSENPTPGSVAGRSRKGQKTFYRNDVNANLVKKSNQWDESTVAKYRELPSSIKN
jgi:hypothetical protein